MLSGILPSLAYMVTSALLALLAITDMLDREAYSARLRHFRRAQHAAPDLPARLAAAAR
ncbi:MAG TPA: hypothetical protein VKT82_06590 [Ktedonobacterales bacterium]|nr:hypothetical protein [Ktedonobacterales bacterium]